MEIVVVIFFTICLIFCGYAIVKMTDTFDEDNVKTVIEGNEAVDNAMKED